jgi:hypothetical protein
MVCDEETDLQITNSYGFGSYFTIDALILLIISVYNAYSCRTSFSYCMLKKYFELLCTKVLQALYIRHFLSNQPTGFTKRLAACKGLM